MALKHAKFGEIVQLRPLGEKLKDAKTHAIIKAEHFEAIRLIVHAGATIPTHDVPGNIILHCLEGHVRLGLSDGDTELEAGDWVFLEPSQKHAISGIKDTCLLMTILFPGS